MKMRKRGYVEFRKSLRHIAPRHGTQSVANMLGVNMWYVHQMLNSPKYKPSDSVRKKLNIILNPRASRFKIYPDAAHIENTLKSMRNHMTPDLLDEIKRRL